MTIPTAPDFVLAPREQLAAASRYQLLGRIAAGGMATVYIGRLRDGDGTLVAVKRAHPHLVCDPVFARMFLAEARLASRIHHPNVVPIRDVEDVEGELLLVMDYVEGGALSDLLFPTRDTVPPLDPRLAIRIVLDVAAGLDAAHELADDTGVKLGVVHRDVSPQNVLVGIDGVARIADFGIAKSLPGTGATLSVGLKGKIAYMAPEYVRHEGFDVRSDVFALGVVAWEALTGKRLFRAPNEIATLKLVLGMKPRRPSAVRSTLPVALDDILLRALEKQPEARWQTVRAFADALRSVAEAEGLVATQAEVGIEVSRRAHDALEAQRSRLARQAEATAVDSPGAKKSDGLDTSYRTASLPRVTITSVSSMSLPTFLPPPRRARPESRTSMLFVGIASIAVVAAVGIATTMPSAHGSASRRESKQAGAEVALPPAPPAIAVTDPPSPDPIAEDEEPTLAVENLPAAPRARPSPARVETRPRAWVRPPPRATPKVTTPKRDLAAPNPYGPAPTR